MSPAARISLAIAVAWAGGFASFSGPGWSRLAAGLAVLLACAWLRSHIREAEPDARLRAAVRVFALALVSGLLARALGRVVIEVPAALWGLPIVGASLLLGGGDRFRRAGLAAGLAVGLALAAAIAGTWFEARAPQPRGLALSGPIIGVHPRQATAVRIDGFGPHDLVVDDYVDPPAGGQSDPQGYDPEGFAAWLELELRAIAATHYAGGPARAREAFANAEVHVADAIVPPAERDAYASLIGVEVRSGTTGEGSMVEFVCPGRTLGSASGLQPSRACPRKYIVDGSTGLGLSSRFPGYMEVRGRDRARIARAIGWPHGDARRDRRSLALESGAWLIALLLAGWALARRRSAELGDMAAALAGWAALALASIAATRIGAIGSLDATTGGPALLALALLALAPAREGDRPTLAWPIAGLLALIAASPLAGIGDVVSLLDATVEALVLGLGLDWSTSRALAGGLAVVVLAAGLGVCAGSLFQGREARQGRAEAIRLALALALGVALALRKPTDDLALLSVGCALLLAASVRIGRPTSSAPRLS